MFKVNVKEKGKPALTSLAWVASVCLVLAVGAVGLIGAPRNHEGAVSDGSLSSIGRPGTGEVLAQLLGYRVDDWRTNIVGRGQEGGSQAVLLYRKPGRRHSDDVPFAAALIVPERGDLDEGLGAVQLYVFTGADIGRALIALQEDMGYEIAAAMADPFVSAAVERAAWYVATEGLGQWTPYSRIDRFPAS